MLSDLTKENAKACNEAVEEMFEAIPKSRRMAYIGRLNTILLFLESAQRELPSEATKKKGR